MSSFTPFRKMQERVEQDKLDSDVAVFFSLLYYAELLTKFITAGLVAALTEDNDRHKYSLAYRLVRADGIGEWASVLDEVLTGPPSQLLVEGSRIEQKELVQRLGPGSWQYEAVSALRSCASVMGIRADPVGNTAAARQWFPMFATLRNKTRGHGAPTGTDCGRVCQPLQDSILLVADNFHLFQRPWAFLHRNLSGKYRVSPISASTSALDYLKKDAGLRIPDGVYVLFDDLARADLVESDVEVSDFLLPNGSFRTDTYELLSYITNRTERADGKKYTTPIQPLPPSQTGPAETLEILGRVFTNLPPKQDSYVARPTLEDQLTEQLLLERHPIVTLTGSGGIGKTSLALAVLHQLATSNENRFDAIIWFSARDIDLLEDGPKRVRPQAVSLAGFAEEYLGLTTSGREPRKGVDALTAFGSALSQAPIGPSLYVFDNFETIVSPIDVYGWVDTFIRAPNKVLITTRIRDFVGDYPIEVQGMTEHEAFNLIDAFSRQLGVRNLITAEYMAEVYKESDGHPYVMRILLGEVAKRRALSKPERIVASRDELLIALFERTYAALTPAAQRVFLLLASWRSVLPELAVEAVILRTGNDRIDVKQALDELRRYSLIEETSSESDGELFVSVPLAAATFGKRKLIASPMKAAVDADTDTLRAFGAARKEDIRHGAYPRIHRLLTSLAQRAAVSPSILEESRPMIEFMAGRVPAVWLDLSRLYQEQGTPTGLEQAKEYLRRYLEDRSGKADTDVTWKRLADLCAMTGDYAGEVHALVGMCESPGVRLEEISTAANRINSINRQLKLRGLSVFDTEERKALVGRAAAVMANHLGELDGDDCSRLAWLYLHLGDEDRARSIAEQGCGLDPSNEYCARLLVSLT